MGERRRTILLVEDNAITRRLIRQILETEGYQVIEAPDGATALRIVSSTNPDLIVQDIALPDIDGFTLLKKFRETPPLRDLPILALTGSFPRQEPEIKFTDLMLKPVEPSRLLHTVRAFLPAESRSLPQVRGRRILAVDDEPGLLALLKTHLEQAGFSVQGALGAEEALRKARGDPPDAIVSDVLMPGTDGYRFCAAVRSDPLLSKIPVVLVSSVYTEQADRDLGLQAGATALVPRTADNRPVIEALVQALESLPARPASEASLPPELYLERALRQVDRLLNQNHALSQRILLMEAEMTVLGALAESLRGAPSVDRVLAYVLHQCLNAAGMSRGAAYLLQADGRLALSTQLGFRDAAADRLRDFFGRADALRHVLDAEMPERVPSLADPEFGRDLLRQAGCQSMLLVPIVSGEERLGVLVMAADGHDMGPDWLLFARAVGVQIAQAVQLARAFSSLAESESKVREAEARYRDLVENLPAVVYLASTDEEGGLLYIGPQIEQITGYAPSEWSRAPHRSRDRIHPEDLPRVQDEWARSAATGKGFQIEYRLLSRDREVVWVRDSAQPMPESGGRTGRIRGFLVDISKQKKAEEEVRRIEEQNRQLQRLEAVGRLAGGVAHDFNNLLMIILGYCDLSLPRLAAGDPLRANLEEIRRAGERAAALTRQLLAFSRKQILEAKVIDLNALVAGVEKMLRRLIGEDIALMTRLDPAAGRIKADPGQIEQVIMNLAVNARDAMPQGGRLEIRTENVELPGTAGGGTFPVKEGPYVMLAVSDTGCGMTDEVKSHLFEPFFTTKEKGKGTGLGLSTVYGIVKQSGGYIFADSEEGQGTTFRIYLPRVDEPATGSSTGVRDPAPQGSETILLVEDEPEVRRLARTYLEGAGYRVLEASCGSEAVRAAASHPGKIDVLVSDVVMPDLNGVEVAQRLKAARAGIKVVYMSGYPDTSIFRRGTLDPGVIHLQKPFTADALLRKVREALS